MDFGSLDPLHGQNVDDVTGNGHEEQEPSGLHVRIRPEECPRRGLANLVAVSSNWVIGQRP